MEQRTIHVERVIGVLKQKYTILQSVIPISLISDKDDEGASIDRLVRVCYALVNLCPSKINKRATCMYISNIALIFNTLSQ